MMDSTTKTNWEWTVDFWMLKDTSAEQSLIMYMPPLEDNYDYTTSTVAYPQTAWRTFPSMFIEVYSSSLQLAIDLQCYNKNINNCRNGTTCSSTMMDCTTDSTKNITDGCTNLCESSTVSCTPKCVNNNYCRSFCDYAKKCTASFSNSNNGQVTCDSAASCDVTITNSDNFYVDCTLVTSYCTVSISSNSELNGQTVTLSGTSDTIYKS